MAATESITETEVKPKKKWYVRRFSIAVIANLWVPIALAISTIVKDNTPTQRLSFMYSILHDNFVNGKMHTSFLVTISNEGKSSFQVVDPVRAKIWYIPISTVTKNPHFNWENYMNTKAYDAVSYTSSYAGEYEPTDSVRNSFDFFVDSAKANNLKYAILVRADAHFETTHFLLCHTTDSDFCYYALIRF